MGKWTEQQRANFAAAMKRKKLQAKQSAMSIPLEAIPERAATRQRQDVTSSTLAVEVKAGSQIAFVIGRVRVTVRAVA